MIPIVLIPGVNGTAELFLSQIVALWPYGPVTVASTLQGGTIAEMAAAILETAPPAFALIGFSMGGYTAFEIMRQAPGRVLKLALLDTSARPDTPEQTAVRRANLERMLTETPETLRAESELRLLHATHRGDARLREIGLRATAFFGIEGARKQQEAVIGRPDSRPTLAGITVPTLVLVGEADAMTPPEAAAEMAAGIPGARLVVIPEAGHMTVLEQPEAVNAALIAWLAD